MLARTNCEDNFIKKETLSKNVQFDLAKNVIETNGTSKQLAHNFSQTKAAV